MLDISLLRNPIQNYPWGSHSAIAHFLGRSASLEPEAELWMGAHAKAPSEIFLEEKWRRLDALIEHDSNAILGSQRSEFPFLFKILAAAQPLSIQAHPNIEQAREGFEREEQLGIPRDARTRNYRDPNSKPELVYALTPFRMLRGFRPAGEILQQVGDLGLLDLLPEARALSDDPASLASFFRACSPTNPSELERLQPILDTLVLRANRRAENDPLCACIAELEQFYPGDPGLLAPLFLQLIELAPGEVIFTGPGVLHAYLEGLGIELMSNSDNVLRSSLTPKHIDVPELMKILIFEPTPTDRLRPRSKPTGEKSFLAPDHSFELCVLDLKDGHPRQYSATEVEILLCSEGEAIVENPRTGHCLPCVRGQALLVPAAVETYRIVGKASFFRATAGSPPRRRTALKPSLTEVSLSASSFTA